MSAPRPHPGDAAFLARLDALDCKLAPDRLAGVLAVHRELADMTRLVRQYLALHPVSVELEPAPVFQVAAVIAALPPC